jgi:hypothetical protein
MVISALIGKALVFVNQILDFFAVSNGTVAIPGISGCDTITVQNVSMTACGVGIADAMGQLEAIQRVAHFAMLEGLLVIQGPTV